MQSVSDRIITKLTSTKTWFLIAAILTAAASYIGGATCAIPDWLCQTGLVCGFVGGGIYAIVTAYQNAKEALASSTQTIVQATSTDSQTVAKIAKVDNSITVDQLAKVVSDAATKTSESVTQ